MRVDEYRTLQANAMSEDTLQGLIMDLARTLGWLAYHTHDSRRSQRGFPDLVLVRDGRVIFAELKSTRGRASVEQMVWLGELGRVRDGAVGADDLWPVQVYLWRPADWFSGAIAAELQRAA